VPVIKLEGRHPWIPNDNEKNIAEILNAIGIKDPLELFSDIPKSIALKKKLAVGRGRPLSSFEIEKEFDSIINDLKDFELNKIFAGGPIAPHYTHPVVDAIISRGEILTAYTPYQPEISQGLLQMLYEYQSAMAILYDVDIVNAGMYDGATALAEASLMAVRVKKIKKVMVPSTLFHEYKDVMKTYFMGPEVSLIEYETDNDSGEATPENISLIKSERPAAVIIDYPANTGEVRRTTPEIIQETHAAGSLAIVFSDPIALGVLTPPGKFEADIVVGEGQSLGLPMYGGGMTLGILGIRNERELIRNLPGRLIGETVDVDGRRGYMMILQSREQHIRREKATSNITTGVSLNSIAALVSLAIKGSNGIRKEGIAIFENTKRLMKALSNAGALIQRPRAVHFKNISFSIPSAENSMTLLENIVKDRKLVPYSIREEGLMSCATEVHKSEDISELENALKEAMNG
jgi:glycine dehydrogenase subunit 1